METTVIQLYFTKDIMMHSNFFFAPFLESSFYNGTL